MANLLIEIGTEELPLDSLDVLYSDFVRNAQKIFGKYRIPVSSLVCEATPRRIALFAESIAERQANQNSEISGPSYEKAYDVQGQPTPALLGFLKSKAATLKDVQIKEMPKGKYVLIQKKETGKPVQAILEPLFHDLMNSMSFPKMMRWETTGLRFPRPLRWLVVLLDKKVIPVRFADLKAGRTTYGHRFLAPKAVSIPAADWKVYQKILKRVHVILSLKERENLISNALMKKFHQPHFDQELVHTTAQLVEEPFFIQGKFSKTYLELPAEVLASSMKKNQKIFACYDRKDNLSGHFVGVMNGKRGGLTKIRAGYENVLESRLRDARYFYETDTKEPFEKKWNQLNQIVYLGKLGSMRDKSERLEKLAEVLASLVGRNDVKADLKRVARLSKIDLLTHLVYEFPDLQGIAGREYARESGENEAVAEAIGTQYLPKNLAEDYKKLKQKISPLGAMFGIIDRLDLLVGAFGIGLEPTGSQDPFALRRAGGSIVKLIRAFGFHISLSEAIDASCDFYGNSIDRPKKEIRDRLLVFLKERTAFEIQAKPGSRFSEILEAVFRSSFDDLADLFKRYEMLVHMYEHEPEVFLKAAKIVERTGNILKGTAAEKHVQPELFTETLEKKLYELVQDRSHEIADFLKKGDYEKATFRFGEVFYEPVHAFFKQVMVNVEDTNIRSNRQALMKSINRLYTDRLADLSVLSRIDLE